MRAALVGLIAAFALASAAAATPRELIDQCVASAPADDEVEGLGDLEVACPGLGAALDELGIGPMLAPSARLHLTRDSLGRLIELATARPTAPRAALDRASLERILPTLGAEPPARSWWDRFKAWLRSLAGGGPSEAGSSWLDRLFSGFKVSEAVASVVFYVLAALILAAAFAIVANEFRAAGAFGPRAATRRKQAVEEFRERERRSLEELAAAPLARRAALMFDLLVLRLGESGRLGAVRERTHRELGGAAPFADPTDRERFARLARVAEEQLFAPRAVAEPRVKAALADGEALIGSLAAAGPPGA